MKPAGKILKSVALIVVVLLVVLYAVFYLFGGYILKVGVETGATKALGVGVDVDGMSLSVLRGSVVIDGLAVANPPGYAHEHLLKLAKGKVAVKIGSLLSETVRVEEIKLDGIDLVIEQKGLSNNLQDVVNSIASGDKPTEDKQETEPTGKQLQVDDLEITNVKVTVKLLPVPGKADSVTLNLDPIKMNNLGTDDKLSTAILAEKIILAIAKGVTKQGVGILPDDLVDTMQVTLDKTVDLGKTATEKGKKVIDSGKDVGSELIEGFKGLLKPKKEE